LIEASTLPAPNPGYLQETLNHMELIFIQHERFLRAAQRIVYALAADA
jgi:hypothetical protein